MVIRGGEFDASKGLGMDQVMGGTEVIAQTNRRLTVGTVEFDSTDLQRTDETQPSDLPFTVTPHPDMRTGEPIAPPVHINPGQLATQEVLIFPH